MAKKKRARVAPSPAASAPAARPWTVTDILLDWRFNLLVLGCMELLIFAFFLPREINYYRRTVAHEALLAQDYARARYYYEKLSRQSPESITYVKALGDVAVGQRAVGAGFQAFRTPACRPGIAGCSADHRSSPVRRARQRDGPVMPRLQSPRRCPLRQPWGGAKSPPTSQPADLPRAATVSSANRTRTSLGTGHHHGDWSATHRMANSLTVWRADSRCRSK